MVPCTLHPLRSGFGCPVRRCPAVPLQCHRAQKEVRRPPRPQPSTARRDRKLGSMGHHAARHAKPGSSPRCCLQVAASRCPCSPLDARIARAVLDFFFSCPAKQVGSFNKPSSFFFFFLFLEGREGEMRERMVTTSDPLSTAVQAQACGHYGACLLYTSPSPRDRG